MFRVALLDIKTALVVFEELVNCVVLPGQAGELSIMSFHQTIVLRLKKGNIKIDRESISIKEGIAKMEDNKLVILADTSG